MSNTECPINDVNLFNFSDYDYPTSTDTFKQLTWRVILKITIYPLMVIFALIGNALVILVVYYNQSMRSTINYYLANLAVADFLITCCCVWAHLINEITSQYVLGAFMCKFNPFAQCK